MRPPSPSSSSTGIAALVWLGPPDEEQLRAASRAGRADRRGQRRGDGALRAGGRPRPRAAGPGVPGRRRSPRRSPRRLGEDGTALAARLPVLRAAVCKHLIAHFSRRNAVIAAAIFIPGVDMPVLTLNQARLVLRIALAYGQEVDRAGPPSCSASSAPASVSAPSRVSCSTSSRSPAGPSRAASPTRARRRSARPPSATSKRARSVRSVRSGS